ncbi:hypothetical protein [Microbacterium lacus]|uniref:hypothetical protein n=1 Tax=Microbacterium lacus TaxID=415217 RepID=UPI0018E2262F|nr:hypothetical protein [Microbacterium lacus]
MGILGVQAAGIEDGARFSILTNEVVAITDPGYPWLPWLAGAVLSLAVFAVVFLWSSRLGHVQRARGIGGFTVAAIGLIVWAMLLSNLGMYGPDSTLGVPFGVLGWIKFGGSSTAPQFFAALGLCSVALAIYRRSTSAEGVPRDPGD